MITPTTRRRAFVLALPALQRVYRFLGVDDRFVPRALDARPKRAASLPAMAEPFSHRLLDRRAPTLPYGISGTDLNALLCRYGEHEIDDDGVGTGRW